MKFRLMALLLTLTVYSWAQNPAPADKPQPEKNAATAPASGHDCACCGHHDAVTDPGSEAKAGHRCCGGHEAKAGSDKASCCSGKGEMACMKADKASCCGQAGKDGKGGCSGEAMSCEPGDKTDAQTEGCCGKSCSHATGAEGI